jgi:hypothetical protein
LEKERWAYLGRFELARLVAERARPVLGAAARIFTACTVKAVCRPKHGSVCSKHAASKPGAPIDKRTP